jgi:hypothetical protein
MVTMSMASRYSGDGDSRRALEKSYEAQARAALSRYYAENTFLVRARIDLDENSADDGLDREAASDETRSFPALPGLPYQPQSLRNSPLSERIVGIGYDILVDTSYTIRDRDFIQYLVVLAANLDTSRGDEVVVERAVFPRGDRSLFSPRKFDDFAPLTGAGTPQLPAGMSAPAIGRDSQGHAILQFPQVPRDPAERFYGLLPLLIVCSFVLLCVWLLSRAIASPGTLRERVPFLRSKSGEDAPAPKASATEAGALVTAAPLTPTAVVTSPSNEPAEDPGALRPYLLNCFVGEPRVCGLILKSWMEKDRVKGWRDVGTLVAGLNPRILQMVQDSLGKENAHGLEIQLASQEPGPMEEFAAIAKEFRREFQNATAHGGNGREDDLFGFLEQLNEGQIMHILRDESMGIVGFALAQLSAEKASSILQRLDPANRSRLLVSMGNIAQIPYNVYKEIADRLSLKALEVSNMKFVSTDGVDSIVALIDGLPVEQQFAYIHSISEMDLNLARKVRERTITLPELAGLPDKFLSDRLQELDGDMLATAFLKMDDALRSKLLSLLPERMQMMVRSSMEAHREVTAAEVDAAQKRLLHSIREEFRKNGRPA